MTTAAKMLGGGAQGRGAEADEANTPVAILDLVRQVAPIGVDPCWNATCGTCPEVGYTIDDNGLTKSWAGNGLVYVNYPFSESKVWIPKVIDESEGAPIVLLSKIDCRVAWWKLLRTCPRYRARVQLDGYCRFGDSPNPATFSVALWLLLPDEVHRRSLMLARFVRAMSNAGEIVYPDAAQLKMF